MKYLFHQEYSVHLEAWDTWLRHCSGSSNKKRLKANLASTKSGLDSWYKTTKVQNFYNPVKYEIHNPITGTMRDSDAHLPVMRAHSEMTLV